MRWKAEREARGFVAAPALRPSWAGVLTRRKASEAMKRARKVAVQPEGEILFATINDPEGLLAHALCTLIARRCHAGPFQVETREDAFLIIVTRIDDYHRTYHLPGVLPEWAREIARSEYPDPMPLAFDPETIEDEQLRRIWRDDLTRSLWTGLRFRRLASRHFNDSVEAIARELRRKVKFDRRTLNALFQRMECFGSSELTGVVAARLYPYLTGQKVFTYTVEAGKCNRPARAGVPR